MENKYYLVPVTAKAIKFERTSFFEMLYVVDPELCMRKKEEMEMKYVMEGLSKEEMIIHQELSEKLSRENNINFELKRLPKQIVVVKTESGIQELATELPITATCDAYLEVFKRTGEDIVEFFMGNENYNDNVINFFDSYVTKEKVLEKSTKMN